MIHAMVTGKLTKDCEIKKSQKGNDYAVLMIRMEDQQFVRANVFGDSVAPAAALKRGDDVTVVGKLEVGLWQGEKGDPRVNLNMMAHNVVSPAIRPPRNQ